MKRLLIFIVGLVAIKGLLLLLTSCAPAAPGATPLEYAPGLPYDPVSDAAGE